MAPSLPGTGEGYVLGAEAHIIASSPNGPRGSMPPPPGGVDSYANLILLCPTHHAVVDKNTGEYTPDVLREMKRKHEQSVRNSQSTQNHDGAMDFVTIPGKTGGIAVAKMAAGISVVADIYGCEPVKNADNRWVAAGISFHQAQEGNSQRVFLFESSEGENDIEYWLSEEKFNVLQFAFLSDERGFFPFIRHEFDLSQFPAPSRLELLITPDPRLAGEIPRLAEEARHLLTKLSDKDAENARQLNLVLDNIWKAGLSAPAQAHKELKNLKTLIMGGEYALCIRWMMREMELVIRAQSQT